MKQLLFAIAAVVAAAASADVTLSGIFTDNMVLQHGRPLPVWGKADPGESVTVARKVGMDVIFDNMGSAFSGMSELMELSGGMGGSVLSEMLDNQTLLDEQYDIVAGEWPTEYNEVVLVVTSDNQISKMTLYMLGMRDPSLIEKEVADLMAGNYESDEIEPFTFEEILGTEFMLLATEDFYKPDGSKTYTADGVEYPVWKDARHDFDYD